MAQILKDKIVFNEQDWLDGLNVQYNTNLTGFQKTKGLGGVRSFNPYRNLGYASPGYNAVDVTGISGIDAVQVNVASNGAFSYSIGGTKIQKIDSLTGEIIGVSGVLPHAVSGANMQDCVIYYTNISSARTKRFFYSWYDGSSGYVGTYDFNTTFDDDWSAAVPASAAAFGTGKPLPMIVGADDMLYIGEANQVHMLNGTTGANSTLTKNVLLLPKEYIITGFAKIAPFSLAIFAYAEMGASIYSGKATMFVWDYYSPSFYKVVELNDNYVSAPFEYKSTVGCFTRGKITDSLNIKTSKLKLFDGNQFIEVASFLGNTPAIGGVEVNGDKIEWVSAISFGTLDKGMVYSYDNSYGLPKVLNQIAEGTGTSNGLIRTLSQYTQLISTGTTTAGGLQKLDYLNNTYTATSTASTQLAKPGFGQDTRGKIMAVKVKFLKATSGGRALTITLYNRNGTSLGVVASAVTTVLAGALEVMYKIDTSGERFKDFDDIKVALSWATGSGGGDAPVVDSIEVYYEPTTIL